MKPARSAWAALQAAPHRYRFDAAVRILLHAAGSADPTAAARFRSPAGLAYPAAEIAEVTPQPAGAPPRVVSTVMGLSGPSGVLPRRYSETVTDTRRDRSTAMHDFTDLLAHRMVAGLAGAGSKYRLARAAEGADLARPRSDAPDPVIPNSVTPDPVTPDPVTRVLLALVGYATPHLVPRLAVGVMPLLHYAGLFAAWPRSADRLGCLVSDWLGRPVEVRQFQGAWLELPPSQRTRLPAGRRPGVWNQLGRDAAIGVRAWDIQARIVLRIGPLDLPNFLAMLPDRPALRRLVSLVRAYLGQETGFAVNPVLAAAQVPALRLGGAAGGRLGWNTWLPQDRARLRDADEPVFAAELSETTSRGVS